MPKNIAVVALSLGDCIEYDNFNSKPFKDQLETICLRIRSICEELSIEAHHADKWIIAWQEYGLSNATSFYIDASCKHLLKETMQALTKEFPKLVILSGTVATQRDYFFAPHKKRLSVLNKIKSIKAEYDEAYKKGGWQEQDEEFLRHKQQVDDTNTFKSKQHTLSIVRNTAYVFHQGECIARHDKSAPCNEADPPAIFQLAKGRNKSPIINIGEEIKIGIEICLEHGHGVLAKTMAENKLEPPDIQFVLSASIGKIKEHIVSPHFIHIDSHHSPSIQSKNIQQDIDITFLVRDLFYKFPLSSSLCLFPTPPDSNLQTAYEEKRLRQHESDEENIPNSPRRKTTKY